ncbi:MAG: response regulator, partial [Candidatus Tectomicrobia bacterium]|nr:response regulator [Candidatus Tectomicrobia bacterium]
MARILIVDDEPDLCRDLKSFLTSKGHEVEAALGGEEGLEKLKSWRPHVVLLDIRMPGVNGLEALPRMKAVDPNVRIIMVTA